MAARDHCNCIAKGKCLNGTKLGPNGEEPEDRVEKYATVEGLEVFRFDNVPSAKAILWNILKKNGLRRVLDNTWTALGFASCPSQQNQDQNKSYLFYLADKAENTKAGEKKWAEIKN